MKKTQHGFTIVEVILFLAISGMFLIIATTMLAGRSQQVQFTDSMRSLESKINSVYQQTVNGVITQVSGCTWRAGPGYSFTADPNDSDGSCIFLGNVVEFASPSAASPSNPAVSEAKIIPIYGHRMSVAEIAACDADKLIFCADPTTNDIASSEIFSIPWGVELSDSANNAIAFGYLRNPTSAAIVPIVFNVDTIADESYYNTNNLYLATHVDTDLASDFSSHFCFKYPGASRTAAIVLGQSVRKNAIELVYDYGGC